MPQIFFIIILVFYATRIVPDLLKKEHLCILIIRGQGHFIIFNSIYKLL